MPAAFLTLVCDEAHARVEAARSALDAVALRERARATPPPPEFAEALAVPGLSVIAELKRASPSRGDLAPIPDAARLARRYVDGGAAAVSVLTEPTHFRGTPADLQAVAAAVPRPVLRKDFVVDAYQLAEARAWGAAAALLIVAALGDDELIALMVAADDLGLDTLVETHDEHEVARAVAAHEQSGIPRRLVLGVNARNLATLEVDLGVIERVAAARPADAVLVAESGVHGASDAARMAEAGADAVLVGEHVATAADPSAAVAALRGAGGAPPGRVTAAPAVTATVGARRRPTGLGHTAAHPAHPGPTEPGPIHPGPIHPGPIHPGPIHPGPTEPGTA